MLARRRGILLVLAVLTLATPGLAAAHSRAADCRRLSAPRTHPPILAFDPRPHAPRVFAMQYRQAPANVASYASFAHKIDCMLRRYVLPFLARGRPNVVVFNEDIGLATIAIGSRGGRARELFLHPHGAVCRRTGQCGALGALTLLTAAYHRPLAAYKRRFPTLHGLVQGFLAATDTVVRAFMRTFSALARRYHLYMIGSAEVAPFRQSRSRADRARFGDPGLRSAPRSVYVATSPRVYNEVLMWGPHDLRRRGPDVLRNVVASNRKVPLTGLEIALGVSPGPASGRAAIANVRPYRLPGTGARLAFATSLPAFTYGTPPAGVDPCSNTALYYMRCLDRLGANLVIQDEANPGQWTGPDGNGIERWQPLSWMASTYRTVSDPSVDFAYNVTAMMVGNLGDIAFDGQSAITERGLGGRGCHYVGNRAFVAGEDQAAFRRYAGSKPDFLALAPWVRGDGPRAKLRRVGNELAASGSRLADDYLETALVADLPFPPDRRRHGCVGTR